MPPKTAEPKEEKLTDTKSGSDADATKKSTKDQKAKKTKSSIRKKKGVPLVPILVLLMVFGGIFAVLWFNVFDLRDQYILPYLRDVPVVGGLLPEPTVVPNEDGEWDYSSMTVSQLTTIIEDLNARIEQLTADKETAQGLNLQYEQVINNLREYERQITQYRQDKAAFDAMLARGDPLAYATFFETISPETAALLYKEVTGQTVNDEEIKRIATTYANMDETAAASGLELLLVTNADLVVSIIRNMDTARVAAIYNEMDSNNVAAITRLLEPIPVTPMPTPTLAPTPTPTPIPEEEGVPAEDTTEQE